MRQNERTNEAVIPTQGEPRKFREPEPDPMASIRNLHIQQRQNLRSVQELNQTMSPATQTPQIQVSQQEDDLIMFTLCGEQQVPQVQGAAGNQEQPKRQRSPRKKKKSEWTLNQKQFDQNKTQKISHISPRECLNVFNGEEPSVLYLQLPVKRRGENRFCTRRSEMGHGRRYCQAETWCKFCTVDTHATQACRRYEKFVRDNPIASSRRNTPVQEQKIAVNIQELNQQPLFPNLPVQRFNTPVIPRIGTNNLAGKRIQRTFSKITSKSNKGDEGSDVSTTSSSKKLPGCSYGSTLPETSTLYRNTPSLTCTTNASRSE